MKIYSLRALLVFTFYAFLVGKYKNRKGLYNLMSIKAFLLFSVFLPVSFSLFAQTIPIVPPSPNAFSLTKGIAYPVSEYTGVPNISIPLYNLSSKNISVPIELNYHASGIKVNDVASYVGLGWNLNAGGVITRVRQGRADFETACDGTDVYNTITDGDEEYSTPDLFYYGLNACDGEPDIFYFNFLGRGGRFILDRDGAPVLLPIQNIKIQPAIGPLAEDMWIITDENGIRFIFGKKENHIEETRVNLLRNHRGYNYWNEAKYVSSWYLSEIHDPSSNNIIYFEYSVGLDTKYRTNIVERRIGLNQYVRDTHSDYEVETLSTKYLVEIKSNSGIVKFNNYEEERLDLSGGRNLKNIEIYNSSGKLIKKLLLKYDYFVSTLSNSENYDKYRLKLTNIIDETLSVSKVLYSFSYNENELLPNRIEGNMDHWGYYNSDVLSGENIPTVFYDNIVWEGSSKDTNPVKVQANILTKVTNPLGGYTEFKYEANKVINPKDGEQMFVGGVRIKKIIESDGANLSNNLITEYNYNNSGSLFRFPSDKDYVRGYYKDDNQQVLFLRSTSQQALLDLSGAHIGYSHVTKILPNNSIEELKFHSFTDRPDILASEFFKATQFPIRTWVDPLGSVYPVEPWYKESNKVSEDYVGIPNTSKFWERGLLIEKFLKTDLGKPIKKINYEYDFTLTPLSTVFAIRFENISLTHYADHTYSGTANYGIYNFISNSSPIIKIIETDYVNYDLNKPLVTTHNFTYWKNLQVKEEIITYPNGKKKKVLLKYPISYTFREGYSLDSNLQGIYLLLESNRISRPIEKIVYSKPLGSNEFIVNTAKIDEYKSANVNNVEVGLLERSLNYYNEENANPFLPSTIIHLPSSEKYSQYFRDSKYEEIVKFHYDGSGNISDQKTRDGLVISFIYGYNNTYPIAKVINANPNEIAYTSFEDKTAKGGWEFKYIIKDLSACTETLSECLSECNDQYQPIGSNEEGIAYGNCMNACYTIYNGCTSEIENTYSIKDGFGITGKKAIHRTEVKKTNLPIGNYVVSFWARKIDQSNYGNVSGSVAISDLDEVWKLYTFTLNNINSVNISVSQNVLLDELRLFPEDAQMTTYTYDPLIGMTSQTDRNGITTYYEYDDLSRLQNVKDSEGNILNSFKYQYKIK